MRLPPQPLPSFGNDFVCSLQCIMYRFSNHNCEPPSPPSHRTACTWRRCGCPHCPSRAACCAPTWPAAWVTRRSRWGRGGGAGRRGGALGVGWGGGHTTPKKVYERLGDVGSGSCLKDAGGRPWCGVAGIWVGALGPRLCWQRGMGRVALWKLGQQFAAAASHGLVASAKHLAASSAALCVSSHGNACLSPTRDAGTKPPRHAVPL